jgi:hypothetical protein
MLQGPAPPHAYPLSFLPGHSGGAGLHAGGSQPSEAGPTAETADRARDPAL